MQDNCSASVGGSSAVDLLAGRTHWLDRLFVGNCTAVPFVDGIVSGPLCFDLFSCIGMSEDNSVELALAVLLPIVSNPPVDVFVVGPLPGCPSSCTGCLEACFLCLSVKNYLCLLALFV